MAGAAEKEAEVKSTLLEVLTPLMQGGRLAVEVLVETLTRHKVFLHPISLKTLVQEQVDVDVKQFLDLLHFDRHSVRWQVRHLPSVQSTHARFTYTSSSNGILSERYVAPEPDAKTRIEDGHTKL
jgi:hypothetical protein